MQKDIDIAETVVFQRTQNAYLSIRIIRFLILLDQCHDFLESLDRNMWKDIKKEVHEKLLEEYNKDIIWLNTTSLYDDTPLGQILPYGRVLTDLEINVKLLSNVSSTRAIKEKFIDDIQRLIGIYNINLQKDLDEWDCTSFSDNLLTLLNPSRAANNVLIGVDATKSSAKFSPLFTNICKVLYSKDINLKVFNSMATTYDAASASSITNQIINMAKQRGRTNIIIGQDVSPNQFYRLKYKDTIFFEIQYNRTQDNNIILYIKNFFGRSIGQPKRRQLISSKYNSVKYLTENYGPSDNIFLFKTFGDIGQIFSFAYESKTLQSFTNIFITFDFMAAIMSSMFIKSTILEDVSNYINGISIFTIDQNTLQYARQNGLGVTDVSVAQILTEMASYKPTTDEMGIEMATDTLINLTKRARADFGNTIKSLSLKNLKDKLKSVGIKVTKTIKGKKVQLTRTELETKAKAFKKLQIKAKEKGVKLKTKSGNFKSKESLEKELGKLKKTRFG